jgi:hypothetical protein
MEPANNVSPWRQFLQRHWQPTPIEPPIADAEIEKLNGLQRSAEVFRFNLLSLEWWLSPNGRLREWLKLHGKISSILLIPAVLVVPLVTFILWQIATWIAFLVQIAGGLIVLPLAALAAAILITGVVILTRMLLGK